MRRVAPKATEGEASVAAMVTGAREAWAVYVVAWAEGVAVVRSHAVGQVAVVAEGRSVAVVVVAMQVLVGAGGALGATAAARYNGDRSPHSHSLESIAHTRRHCLHRRTSHRWLRGRTNR